MANKSPFSWDPDLYYVDILKSINIKESDMRAEYAKLRKSVQRRVSRLRVAGYNVRDLETYIDANLNYTSKSASVVDLPYLLSDAARFLRRETSTVAGRRNFIESSVKRLNEDSYDFVTVSNFEDFAWFMDAWHKSEYEGMYSSEQIAELYETAIQHAWNIEDVKKRFGDYMERQDELASFTPKSVDEKDRWSSERTLAIMDELKGSRSRK